MAGAFLVFLAGDCRGGGLLIGLGFGDSQTAQVIAVGSFNSVHTSHAHCSKLIGGGGGSSTTFSSSSSSSSTTAMGCGASSAFLGSCCAGPTRTSWGTLRKTMRADINSVSNENFSESTGNSGSASTFDESHSMTLRGLASRMSLAFEDFLSKSTNTPLSFVAFTSTLPPTLNPSVWPPTRLNALNT